MLSVFTGNSMRARMRKVKRDGSNLYNVYCRVPTYDRGNLTGGLVASMT